MPIAAQASLFRQFWNDQPTVRELADQPVNGLSTSATGSVKHVSYTPKARIFVVDANVRFDVLPIEDENHRLARLVHRHRLGSSPRPPGVAKGSATRLCPTCAGQCGTHDRHGPPPRHSRHVRCASKGQATRPRMLGFVSYRRLSLECRIARYVEESVAARGEARSPSSNTPGQAVVEGVQLVHAATVRDLRGNLSAREFGRGLPFEPQRVFAVFDVPTQEVRGEHAHKECAQLLVCLRGTVSVVCDDGRSRQQFDLDSPEVGVYVPPMVWATQYKYSADAVLLVYASHPYDAKDYIRNYDEFLAALRARRP